MRIKALLLALLVSLGACGDGPAVETKETLYVFGTLVEFTIRGVSKEKAQEATAAIGHEFQRMHKDWHAWKPGGELMDLNTAIKNQQPFKASSFLLPLVVQAKDLYEKSDGLFDAGIGRLVGAWGFHADELPKGDKPPMEEIRLIASKRPSIRDLNISGDTVFTSNNFISLDFGGFAKGVALDRAVARLKEFGIENAIVNAGGDLNTIGSAEDRLWKVGIRHPKHWGVIASVELNGGENLHTSGNYQRYREHEGVRYAHIIDPRTGMPVDHIVSASVISENGGLADAAATALSVAGPQEWHRIAKRLGVKYVMLVDDEGTVYMNPAMKERVKFEPGEPKKLIVSASLN